MTDRAVLYARTSGDDRGKGNIPAQVELCHSYAQRQGYSVVGEIAEDERGASGAAAQLPGRTELLERAEAGEYDVLVVRDADRLARGEAVFHYVKKILIEAGVRIESTSEGILATPESETDDDPELGGLFAWRAAWEARRIAIRLKRGRRNRVKRGGVMVAKRPPFGYQAERVGDPEKGLFALVPNQAEARIVRQVFRDFAGGREINEIVRGLTAEGVPTPADANPLKGSAGKRRGHAQWCRQTTHRILKNETYAGTWTFGKNVGAKSGKKAKANPPEKWISVPVPALIDAETWQAAQARLEANRRNATRPTRHTYLLRGRIRCGVCGAAMTGTACGRDGSHLYYRCGAKRGRDYAHTCDSKMVRAELVDGAVWEWIAGLMSDPAAFTEAMTARQAEQAREAGPMRERLATLDALVKDHEGQLRRLLDLYVAGDFGKDVLAERKVRIESTLAALQRERADVAAALENRVMSDAGLARLTAFAQDQAANVSKAGRFLGVRRKVLESLDARVTIARENDAPIVYARCAVAEDLLRAPSSITSGTGCGAYVMAARIELQAQVAC